MDCLTQMFKLRQSVQNVNKNLNVNFKNIDLGKYYLRIFKKSKNKINKIKIIHLQLMLNKYQHFIKISKNIECSFYEANIKSTNQKVLIKRITKVSNFSWNNVLCSNAIRFQSKSNSFPKCVQIFKQKKSFFIVYQKGMLSQHLGQQKNQKSYYRNIKIELIDFLQFMNGLCQQLRTISQFLNQDNIYIYPEWIFKCRNGFKICHFQPYLEHQKRNNEHVFLFDQRTHKRTYSHTAVINSNNEIISPAQYIKNTNSIFNIGLTAYNFLTGKNVIFQNLNKNQYQEEIQKIQQNAYKQVFDLTNDKKIGEIIQKMIKIGENRQNSFEVNNGKKQKEIQLTDIIKFFAKKNKQYSKSRYKQSQNTVIQIRLQKIKLTKQHTQKCSIKTLKKIKPIRLCCNLKHQQQMLLHQRTHSKQQKEILKSKEKNSKQKELKKKISKREQDQIFTTNRRIPNRHRINQSCMLPTIPKIHTERKPSLFQKTSTSSPYKVRNQFKSADNLCQYPFTKKIMPQLD